MMAFCGERELVAAPCRCGRVWWWMALMVVKRVLKDRIELYSTACKRNNLEKQGVGHLEY